jgi:hypothetical protein
MVQYGWQHNRATLIAKQQLGANQTGQLIAAVFVATIPMGILQASSTQNDYVLSFWLICFVYFIEQFRNDPSCGTMLFRPPAAWVCPF